MNKIAVGHTISTLANLGVIAGIAFLAMELRQNNTLMSSQSRAIQFQHILDIQDEVLSNSDLVEVLLKADDGQSLSAAEQLRLQAFQQKVLLGMQFQFEEFQNGALDRINLPAWKAIYRGDNSTTRVPLNAAWVEFKDVLRPEFSQFFQANVVDQYAPPSGLGLTLD